MDTQEVSVLLMDTGPLIHVSAVSFAGLWYLSLFLTAKFNVFILKPSSSGNDQGLQSGDEESEHLLHGGEGPEGRRPLHEEPAAPMLYLLPLPYVPLGLAVFISGTRYFDFTNHGFDVIAGAVVGVVAAWFGFRLYHGPLKDPVGAR